MIRFAVILFVCLLSCPIWAQEPETPDEGSGEIREGTPVTDPDAPALGVVVDEAQRLVDDALKGRVVRSDGPRLVAIEQQLRLLQSPPKSSRPAHRTHPPTVVPAPTSLGEKRHRALWGEQHRAGIVSRSFMETRDARLLATTVGNDQMVNKQSQARDAHLQAQLDELRKEKADTSLLWLVIGFTIVVCGGLVVYLPSVR